MHCWVCVCVCLCAKDGLQNILSNGCQKRENQQKEFPLKNKSAELNKYR